jgi:hypothetical protein
LIAEEKGAQTSIQDNIAAKIAEAKESLKNQD